MDEGGRDLVCPIILQQSAPDLEQDENSDDDGGGDDEETCCSQDIIQIGKTEFIQFRPNV